MKTKIIRDQNILFQFLLLGSSFHSYIIVCVFMMCKLIMHTTKGYVFKVACNECSAKMKKCLICGELITEKVIIIYKLVLVNSYLIMIRCPPPPPILTLWPRERSPGDWGTIILSYLVSYYLSYQRYEDLEEQHFCKICLERPYNTAFSPCGHQACDKCAETLDICHYCRQHIEKKLNLYWKLII